MSGYEWMYFFFHAIFSTVFHSILCQTYSNSKFLRERESDCCDLGQVSLLCPDSCVQEIRTDGLVLLHQGFWAHSLGRASWVWPAIPPNSLRNRICWKTGGVQVSGKDKREQRVCWFFFFTLKVGQRLKEWPESKRVMKEVVFSGESQASVKASKRRKECLKKD